MEILKKSSNWVGAPLALAVLAGCSLSSSKDNPSLHLDLSSLQDRSGQYSLLKQQGIIYGLAPPQAASGFSCYGVNVTGPGIMDTSNHPDGDPMVIFEKTLTVPGTYCAYPGVITPPIYLSGGTAEVGMQVPPGGIRLVQVFGVNDTAVCSSGTFVGNDSSGGGSKYFEIGRGVVMDLFSDRSVEINSDWPSTAGAQGDIDRNARALDCGGHCINPSGSADNISNFDFTSLLAMPTTVFAQKITVAESTYLRRVDVALASVSALADVTLTVYTDASGFPGTSTGYAAIVNSVPTAMGMVSFDMFSVGLGYLNLQPGTTYWLKFAATNSVKTAAPGGTPEGTAGDVKRWSGSWVPETSTNRIFTKIRACN